MSASFSAGMIRMTGHFMSFLASAFEGSRGTHNAHAQKTGLFRLGIAPLAAEVARQL